MITSTNTKRTQNMKYSHSSSVVRWWCWLVLGAALVFQPQHHFTFAYPNGAGQCIGGRAAVGGEHLTLNPSETGSLVDGGLEVTVNGDTTLTENGGPYEIATNTDYTIAIGISSSGGFRGALIRASSDNGETDFTLQAADDFGQEATSVCSDDGVLGVTHVTNDIKPSLSATLNVAFVGTITLDITVVQAANDNDGSYYYYSPFTLTVVEAAVENVGTDSNSTETSTSSPVAEEPSPTEPSPSEPSPSEPSPSEPSASEPEEPAAAAPAKSPTTKAATAAAATPTLATAPSAPTKVKAPSAPTKSAAAATATTGSSNTLCWVVVALAILGTLVV
jgi:hypothetical protein